MSVKILSAALSGIESTIVSVEIDITRGLPAFHIVGMADLSVKEAKERVRSAILNSGFEFPVNRITVNLAPGDLKKVGTQFDLPIAIGILMATSQITTPDTVPHIILGELSLFGEIRKITGALPIILDGIKNHIFNFIVPFDNAKECSVVSHSKIYAFTNLKEVVSYLEYNDLLPFKNTVSSNEYLDSALDFSDVIGQESCKRALEVAAAGGHNLIMIGPPGAGKTMIAQRIPTILPQLSYEAALEVTKIYSITGNSKKEEGLITIPPFRNPHHTASKIALVGGGNNLMPGEISLAHNGVLFLDEMLEFKKSVLDVLRQPLEDRTIKISRSNGTVTYPANIMLVGALNPCICGNFSNSPNNSKACTCTEYDRKRYLSRLSGPLLDRIDIFMFVTTPSYGEIKSNKQSNSSALIRKNVEMARKIQAHRYEKENIFCNAQLNAKQINTFCKLDKKSSLLIERAYNQFQMSTRSYSRILKVSRSIADLNGSEKIQERDIIEAIQYRKFLGDAVI